MARRNQIKIYSLNAVTLIGTISDEALMDGSVGQEIGGEDKLEFNIDRDHASFAHIAMGRVASLTDLTDVETRNYRIVEINDERQGSQYFTRVVCLHLHFDLAAQVNQMNTTLIQQTPTTHLTQILSGSGWTVGTVTPTALLTIQYAHNKRLFDLEQLREATGYDLVFTTTVGASPTKVVSLATMGVVTPVSSIQYAKNLLTLVRQAQIPEANMIYGIGGEGSRGVPMTIETATHRITAIASLVITMDSDKILSSDGSLDGKDLASLARDNVATIVSSEKQVGGNDKFTVDDTGLLSIGMPLYITFASQPLKGLSFVHDQDSIDSYGKRESTFKDENFQDVLNLIAPTIKSTLSDTYTTGLCAGWDLVFNPTVSENTNAAFVINGTKSQKVIAPAFTGTMPAPDPTVDSEAGGLNGAYTYKQAYVTIDGEGPLSVASITVNPANERVSVDNSVLIGDPHIIAWRLYRIKASGATYYLIAEIPSSQSVFVDTLEDALLTTEPPASTTKASGGRGVSRSFTAVVDKEYAAVIYLFVVSGRVRCELTVGETFPSTNMTSLKKATPTISGTTKFIVKIEGLKSTSVNGLLSIVAHEGTAEFYVDSAMVVESAYAPNPDKFIGENAATELWYKTYDELQRLKSVSTKFTISAADLHEAGDSGDKMNVGDVITLTDSEFGISAQSVRIVKKSYDLLKPQNAQFEIDVAQERFSREIAGILQRNSLVANSGSRQATRLSDSTRMMIGTSGKAVMTVDELRD
jgi:hypothetical protein